MQFDVIIIGAGAAGLLARYDLLQLGYRVCLLEATGNAGGRMATVHENGFGQPVETGAEFVHGELPLTLALLNKAGIAYVPVEGEMQTVQNGQWKRNETHDKHWNAFSRQLKKLKTDTSIADFLDKHFAGEKYKSLHEAVRHYAEGFDLADTRLASALAAKLEWTAEEETQYRLPGGYQELVAFLIDAGGHPQTEIFFNTCAASIQYDHAQVRVLSTDGRSFEAPKLLLTVSAGILQSNALQFIPALGANYAAAIQNLGFGAVIKFLFQFKTAFWEQRANDLGFILSDEAVPTWWTQLSVKNELLTGWLGGPPAAYLSTAPEETLLQTALSSLSNIFDLPVPWLTSELVHHKICCWAQHPYIKGGYSYIKLGSAEAKKTLSHPVAGTIFFAGEALYRGQSQGTVEAALQTGRDAAKKIMKGTE